MTSPPLPPPGELDETYALSLILAYSLHYIEPHVIRETGST